MIDKRTLEFILADQQEEICQDGHSIKVQPVYEWSLEILP